MTAKTVEKLPLRSKTPVRWAKFVLAQPLVLLNDHAHLEKKAATNALELLNRWPEPNPPEGWVTAMTAVARDEVEHLAVVTRILARRGGRLTRSHRCTYAAELRKLVRGGVGDYDLLDRLIVSALIEARSCERFFVLSEHCEDRELAKLYKGLYASEAGHYRTFLALAEDLLHLDPHERWDDMLDAEAEIIGRMPVTVAMHGGVEPRA
jgi:tRNA-(ms[2]io[6]A)-hydroxylase